MRLSDLVYFSDKKDTIIRIPHEHLDLNISGITSDSRLCRPDFLFAALQGSTSDGRLYISDAINRGATAILTSGEVETERFWHNVCIIKHENPRRILAFMAANFNIGQPNNIAAITGTNGKTSTVHFCRQLWKHLEYKSASMGTLGVISENNNEITDEGCLTTPDAIDLHEYMNQLVYNGVDYLAIEASSHGLDQERLAAVRLTTAAITNLTRDHLDYHGTPEKYFEAKMRLFEDVLRPNGVAVINTDIEQSREIAHRCMKRGLKIITYGKFGGDVRLIKSIPTPEGQNIKLEIQGKEYEISTNLIGAFQVNNLMCAIAIVINTGKGVDAEKVVHACGKITNIPGRMEKIAVHKCGAPIVVDYAHTPDALENVLSSLRPHTTGKLIVLFGCGGDRDKGKRAFMGDIASRLADISIITDDNPRNEDASAIRKEIISGRDNMKEIGDRKEAIEYAVSILESGDILVIAGKGHEKHQIIKGERLPFNDAETACFCCSN